MKNTGTGTIMSDASPNLTGIPGGRSALEDRFDVVDKQIAEISKSMGALTIQMSESAANKITESKSSPTSLGAIKDGVIIGLVILIGSLAFIQINNVEERAEKRLDDFSDQTRLTFTAIRDEFKSDFSDIRQRLKDDNDRAERVHDRLISRLDKLNVKTESTK